jgi:hypothetical protein
MTAETMINQIAEVDHSTSDRVMRASCPRCLAWWYGLNAALDAACHTADTRHPTTVSERVVLEIKPTDS